MLLRNDDPRAAILLAWLATRGLLDREAIGVDMEEALDVGTPAEAAPWVSRWDGLMEDVASSGAAVFLERFHEGPLRALILRTCGTERPALDALEGARFERVAKALDGAFKESSGSGLQPADLNVIGERAGVAARGLTWVPAQRAFVRAVEGVAQRVELRVTPVRGATGLSVGLRASVSSERVERFARSLPPEPPRSQRDRMALHRPLLQRSTGPTAIPHRGRLEAGVDALVKSVRRGARWVSAFDSPAAALDALAIAKWRKDRTINGDHGWPRRRTVFAVLHGLESPEEALAWARAAYAVLAVPDPAKAAASLAPLLERAATFEPGPDEPAAAQVSRLRHPKFGAGTVLERRGDKVVIAFDDGTERTILERFCTPE